MDEVVASFYTCPYPPTRPCTPVEDDFNDSSTTEDKPYYVTNPSRSFISSLPGEILLHIFFFLTGGNICNQKGSIWHWIYITQVCQLWRDTAIKCTPLWTYINITTTSFFPPSPKLIQIFLKNSKESNLFVRCLISGEHRSEVERCLGIVLGHLGRIQELEIGSLTSSYFRSFPNVMRLIKNPAPKLEKVNLWYYPSSVLSGYLPATIFGNIVEEDEIETTGRVERWTSALKSVMLRNFSIHWGTTLFSGLTELVLSNSESSSEMFTIGTVLRILGNCPELERFVASMVKLDGLPNNNNNNNNAANSGTRSESRRQMVELPKLKWIEILETDYTICEKLMASLILPPDICYNFDMDRFPSPMILLPSLYPLSLSELLKYDQTPCKSLSIVLEDENVYLRGSLRGDMDWKDDDLRADRCLRFRVGEGWTWDTLMLMLMQTTPQQQQQIVNENLEQIPDPILLNSQFSDPIRNPIYYNEIILNTLCTILAATNWHSHIMSLDLEITGGKSRSRNGNGRFRENITLSTYRRLFGLLPGLERIGVRVSSGFAFGDGNGNGWAENLVRVLEEKGISISLQMD